MDTKIKKRWVKALRSGKYPKAKHNLRTNEGYCCLGVLCDLYAKSTKDKWEKTVETSSTGKKTSFYSMDKQGGVLPTKVREWASLDASIPYVIRNGKRTDLATINDKTRITFKGIAKLIEEQL